jgi:hypothetical protein
LDLILAASCGKLGVMESTQEQNLCGAGEDKSNQKEDERRNRRSRFTARRLLRSGQGSERLRLVKAVSSEVPFFQGGTQRLATADGHRKEKT